MRCLFLSLSSAAYSPANADDALFIVRHPNEREISQALSPPADNRTAVALGATIDPDGTGGANILLRCVAAHTDDAGHIPGTLVWIRNGLELSDGDSGGRVAITPLVFGTRYGAELQITAFEESDAGIYQCVATDAASSDSDVATSFPHRLDTGTRTHSGGCCVGQCNSSGNDAPLSRPCWR